MIFANVCLNMVEHRMSEPEYFHYGQNWWISLNKSGDTGGPLRNRSDFNEALSTLNRLHREAGGRQLRPTPIGSTSNGDRHRVLPPLGGNGVDPGGLPENSKKVNERGCMQRFMIERSNPLSTELWRKPQTNVIHEFIYFVADGSFTADGGPRNFSTHVNDTHLFVALNDDWVYIYHRNFVEFSIHVGEWNNSGKNTD